MKRCVIGILAHVDAGKTTLSEAMLFSSGMIRTLGRVDHGDAFLDTFSLERKRGITIFSKQAVIDTPKMHAVLLDTPGHADFSSEAERTLDVLDCAILVLSGSEGIQSHTRTIWKLLKRKNIPTLLFINKMDLPTPPREEIIASLNAGLQDGFFDITAPELEAVSMCGEELLDEYLETGSLSTVSLVRAFARREIFPCVFGAALRLDGVDTLLDCLETYAPEAGHKSEFGARVYKISRDDKGVRLTHIKLTGGTLRVRDIINGEKVTQLRIYSGAKFTPVDAVSAGEIAVVTGLNSTHIGQGLGSEPDSPPTTLEPVLTYTVELPEGCDVHKTVVQLMQLEEEDPQLHLTWNERTQQLRIRLMGQIQLEIIRQVVLDRFGLEISFGPGEILYRETIKSRVEGVGHFEPLRHYAEVHLLLEPGAPGSGITAVSSCPEDVLDRNWQRLIMTHIFERRHLGVLTGSPLTDVKITLASGKSHPKHTEGGDFRQATYRAIRQGLMQAESVLLEPWYDYRMELPQSCVGRAVTDLQRMGAEYEQPETDGENAVLTGRMPVASLGDYHREFTAYTHGAGRLFCTPGGYAPCTTQDEVVASFGYEPESDLDHSPDSVFCEGGAGYIVKWFDVPEKMHLPSCLAPQKKEEHSVPRSAPHSLAVSDDELMAIFERTYGPIKRDKYTAMRKKPVHSDT
ncbi:MAG: TetM/TetW/TetO/TetS family tetracycline resistance ribosomal protection protein, partial [Oscillospiraceae bacterium]|nr:TetM/TetW/TetO/TetS family tetracycline resistance ribosomal protection protein [Oscillospiraceae bacterium]